MKAIKYIDARVPDIEDFVWNMAQYHYCAEVARAIGASYDYDLRQFVTTNSEAIGPSHDPKANHDYYRRAEEVIRSYGISYIKPSVFPNWGAIIIGLSRPGLLIGKRGYNIKQLSSYCGVDINVKEADSIVDKVIYALWSTAHVD